MLCILMPVGIPNTLRETTRLRAREREALFGFALVGACKES